MKTFKVMSAGLAAGVWAVLVLGGVAVVSENSDDSQPFLERGVEWRLSHGLHGLHAQLARPPRGVYHLCRRGGLDRLHAVADLRGQERPGRNDDIPGAGSSLPQIRPTVAPIT